MPLYNFELSSSRHVFNQLSFCLLVFIFPVRIYPNTKEQGVHLLSSHPKSLFFVMTNQADLSEPITETRTLQLISSAEVWVSPMLYLNQNMPFLNIDLWKAKIFLHATVCLDQRPPKGLIISLNQQVLIFRQGWTISRNVIKIAISTLVSAQ